MKADVLRNSDLWTFFFLERWIDRDVIEFERVVVRVQFVEKVDVLVGGWDVDYDYRGPRTGQTSKVTLNECLSCEQR